MPVVIGSVQPVQPVHPFRQILIIGGAAAAQCRRGGAVFFLVCFYLIGFLVGHPGQVGPLQQNQALLASNQRSVPWTPWTDLVPPSAMLRSQLIFTIGVRRSRTVTICRQLRFPNQDVVSKQAETDQPTSPRQICGFRGQTVTGSRRFAPPAAAPPTA
jgi:hypothetical protein